MTNQIIKNYSDYHNEPEAWDVVVLSLKLLFTRIQFWIRPNILSVLFSALVVSAPGCTGALYHTVSLGLYDPAGSSVKIWTEMKSGFIQYFGKALALFLIKSISLIIILIGIFYWVSQSELILRFISILAFYGLVMWWLSEGYIYPIMVTEKDLRVDQIVKKAITTAFKYPFQSLLFSIVSTLLLILGLVLLGPIMLIVPAARAIIHLHGYWFVSQYLIPGLLSVEDFSKLKYQVIQEGLINEF